MKSSSKTAKTKVARVEKTGNSTVFKFHLEPLDHFAEFRRINLVPVFPLLLQEIIQFQLRREPNRGFQTLADFYAFDFNFPKVITAANVLEQVRHFRKRIKRLQINVRKGG